MKRWLLALMVVVAVGFTTSDAFAGRYRRAVRQQHRAHVVHTAPVVRYRHGYYPRSVYYRGPGVSVYRGGVHIGGPAGISVRW